MRQSIIIQNFVLFSLSVATPLAAWSYVTQEHTYRVELQMSHEESKALKSSNKTEVDNVKMKVFSHGELTDQEQVEVSTRGQSSLKKFSRKNFSIKVDKSENGEKKKIKVGNLKSKHFVMSASPEDVLFIKNSIGYRLLKILGIHSLKTQFAEVLINEHSEGLYMMTENQSESLIKDKEADVVFRRRYNDALELKDAKKDLSRAEISRYRQTLFRLHKSIREMHGDKLIETLSKNMNLDNYLKWLAFNYIMRNGDFSDEVYFYGKKNDKGEIYFDISPWDMDDTFSKRMHLSRVPTFPNNGMRDESEKQLLFGYESRIDRKVASDLKLLKMYFAAMEEVVNKLSANNQLEEVEAKILKDLNPYLDDADIQQNGLLDSIQKAHSREAIQDNVRTKIQNIKSRIEAVKMELEKIKTEEKINYRVLDLSGLRKVLIKIDNSLLRYFTK